MKPKSKQIVIVVMCVYLNNQATQLSLCLDTQNLITPQHESG